MLETRHTAILQHAGTPRDGANAWVQSSAASAHRMHIRIFNMAVRKTMTVKNTNKITDS